MSAIKNVQEKVVGDIANEGGVAGFDFGILTSLAMKILMEYLGNCLNKSTESANARIEDGFWFQYFAQKAAKDAVEEMYPKKERTKEARKMLAEAIGKVSVEDRKACAAELKQAHEDAGFLF